MAVLVTLRQASEHLRLDMEFAGSPETTEDDRATDLQLKLDQAEGIIINYLKLDDDGLDLAMNGDPDASPVVDPTWNARDTFNVQSAVLLVLSALYDDEMHRTLGDYMATNTGVIPLLLMRLRDPAIA